MGDWRANLGAVLIVERVQKKQWNKAQAAREADVSEGTIDRIERGGNYEVESLEKYANTLGRPLEDWLRDILGSKPVAPAADAGRRSVGEAKAPTKRKSRRRAG